MAQLYIYKCILSYIIEIDTLLIVCYIIGHINFHNKKCNLIIRKNVFINIQYMHCISRSALVQCNLCNT